MIFCLNFLGDKSYATMTTTLDFGFVNDVERLKRLIKKLTLDFVENDFNSPLEEVMSNYMYPVNFCDINNFSVLTLSEEIDDDSGTIMGYKINIFHRRRSIILTSSNQFDTQCLDEMSNGIGIEVLIECMLKKIESMNIRKIEICPTCDNVKRGGKQICGECELCACEYNADICPICLDKEDTCCIWVETECKHIFHKKCLRTLKGFKKNIICPVCRQSSSWSDVNDL